MAYSDYGAFVYKNGLRRPDKEDAPTYRSAEETFGTDIDNIPSAARIFMSLLKAQESGKALDWVDHIHHGICGDGAIRVVCHKQGLPQIFEKTENGIREITFYDPDETDYFDYHPFDFSYKGYRFHFESGKPYVVEMDEPDGAHWRCEYDYLYGAGFDDE